MQFINAEINGVKNKIEFVNGDLKRVANKLKDRKNYLILL